MLRGIAYNSLLFRKLRFDVIKDYTSKLRPFGEKNHPKDDFFLMFLNNNELRNTLLSNNDVEDFGLGYENGLFDTRLGVFFDLVVGKSNGDDLFFVGEIGCVYCDFGTKFAVDLYDDFGCIASEVLGFPFWPFVV